jgi:prephenate dehydrogenase
MKQLNNLEKNTQKTIKKIAIIGGQGQMGQLFYRYLSKYPELLIKLIDRENFDEINNCLSYDFILISVPIDLTENLIREKLPKFDEKTILCDITSVKSIPLQAMLDTHQGPVIGLHPMFGPTIESTENQVIVHCPGRHLKAYQWFLDYLVLCGFKLETISAQTHDQLMNFVQGIEHFSSFCLGSFLKKQNINLEQLLNLASPVYQMELNIVGRLFYQSPELYADIIMADKNRLEMIESYIDHVKDNLNLLKNNDRAQFIDKFKSINQWMGKFSEKAYNQTDKTLKK